MSTVEEVLTRHVERMRKIEERDRQLATSLATIQNVVILNTAAAHIAKRGGEFMKKHADEIFQIMRDGERAQHGHDI